ncbi:hypothetical protein ACS0TY_026431 [Phlomoides rotata]
MAESVPSRFKHIHDPTALSPGSLPVVDFSALTAGDPDQYSKSIHDLAKACEEWGFFVLVNHGGPEELMNAAVSGSDEFFNLGDDEKVYTEETLKYVGLDAYDNPNQTFSFWGEKLRLHVHPKLHCPNHPQSLREVVEEYSERSRKVARKLVEALSDALQLEKRYVDGVLGLDSSCQLFVAHKYPPCRHPDQVIGVPPHTDPSILTLLIHNGVPGLQIKHHGQWCNDQSPKNSILVNVGDQLESFSNGRYKSIKHRVVVHEEKDRLSVAWFYAPSWEAVFGPAAPLVEKDGRAMYPSSSYEAVVKQHLTKPLSSENYI